MQVQVHPAQQSVGQLRDHDCIVLIVVVALRMRRMGKMRPLKLETLWVVPAIYLGVAVLMFVQLPPTGVGGDRHPRVGLLIGAAVGWQRGKMMQIHVDPESHALNQKASPGGDVLPDRLIVVRMLGARCPWRRSRSQSGDGHRSPGRIRAWDVHA